MSELKLTDDSDREFFARVAHALDEAGAKIVSEDDYQQLLYPLDQMYIDYSWEGKLFTLHLEHYLGIFLLSDELNMNALNVIASKISNLIATELAE